MEPREFYSRKWKLAGWLCACLAFVVTAFLEARDGDGLEAAGGWSAVILFGFVAVLVSIELLRSGPRLVLSGEGLYDRSLGTPVIPWQSIVNVTTPGLKKSGYITLQLADEAKRVAKLSVQRRALAAWNKKLGGDVFNMSVSALSAPPSEVVQTIVAYRNHYGLKHRAAGTDKPSRADQPQA